MTAIALAKSKRHALHPTKTRAAEKALIVAKKKLPQKKICAAVMKSANNMSLKKENAAEAHFAAKIRHKF